MPFRTFAWSDGSVVLEDRTPDPELRQVDEDTFVILRSFCYRAPRADPDEGTVYLVPGEDLSCHLRSAASTRASSSRPTHPAEPISRPCRPSSGGLSRATGTTRARRSSTTRSTSTRGHRPSLVAPRTGSS
jgi:hypothetical protein